MTEFGQELDVLVLGAYYGEGRRGGIHSSFLCGLRVDDDPPRMKFAPSLPSDIDSFPSAKLAAVSPRTIMRESGTPSLAFTNSDILLKVTGSIRVRRILLQLNSWNSNEIMKNPISGFPRIGISLSCFLTQIHCRPDQSCPGHRDRSIQGCGDFEISSVSEIARGQRLEDSVVL